MKTLLLSKSRVVPFLGALIAVLCLSVPLITLASQTYVPLVGIPGLDNSASPSLGDYVNKIYILTVSLGALIAFLKITIAGAKYIVSDVITSKSEAKSDIKGALLGLAILLIPFIVLNTIYGGLTNLDILNKARPIEIRQSGSSVQPSTGTTNSGTPSVGSVVEPFGENALGTAP